MRLRIGHFLLVGFTSILCSCVLFVCVKTWIRYIAFKQEVSQLNQALEIQKKRHQSLVFAIRAHQLPAYVEAQIKTRLNYVYPDETIYVIE